MLKLAVVAHANDNVATTVKKLTKGEKVTIDFFGEKLEILLKEDIPFGHKFAIDDIKEGTEVFKYGEAIGQSTENVEIGKYVHTHNLVSERGRGDLEAAIE